MVYCMTLNTRNFDVFLVWTLCQQWHVNIVVHKLGKPAKGKPKHYFIPYFVLSNNLFQCWYIKDVKHHQHYMYIPKTILEMRPSIFCLRKLSRELILDWYCSIEIPILLTPDKIVGQQQTLVNRVCGWFIQFDSTTTTARTTDAQESLLLSNNFRTFQILSDAFRYSQI